MIQLFYENGKRIKTLTGNRIINHYDLYLFRYISFPIDGIFYYVIKSRTIGSIQGVYLIKQVSESIFITNLRNTK